MSSTTRDCVDHLWRGLNLPQESLTALDLQGGDGVASPSSFKIGHLAQSCIAVSGLAAALFHASSNSTECRHVTIQRQHAVAEFQTEKLHTINDKRLPFRASIGGLHQASDGYVRVHDGFPNLCTAALKLVGCPSDASKEEFMAKLRTRSCQELEDGAVEAGAVIYKLRTPEEWDTSLQAEAVNDFPVTVSKLADSVPRPPVKGSKRALEHIRVIELSRVLAAPVAGRTLAVHGADVVWITSPNLPNQPELDTDTSRGKRTVQLDLNDVKDKEKLLKLLDDADVFLQSYRPESLAARGFGIEDLLTRRSKPLVYARLTAWGTNGPWALRRGFDSIVQTVSGLNVSEAEYFGAGQTARPLPCQALDHAAGYLLASGIMAALHRQLSEGGSHLVDVSLAGVMKYLQSLGRYEDRSCFSVPPINSQADIPPEWLESKESGFGTLTALRHSVQVQGLEVSWKHMPKPLGSDKPTW